MLPLGLFHWGSRWTLGCWCELRDAHRSVRLDGIEELTTLLATFEDVAPTTIESFLAAVSE